MFEFFLNSEGSLHPALWRPLGAGFFYYQKVIIEGPSNHWRSFRPDLKSCQLGVNLKYFYPARIWDEVFGIFHAQYLNCFIILSFNNFPDKRNFNLFIRAIRHVRFVQPAVILTSRWDESRGLYFVRRWNLQAIPAEQMCNLNNNQRLLWSPLVSRSWKEIAKLQKKSEL